MQISGHPIFFFPPFPLYTNQKTLERPGEKKNKKKKKEIRKKEREEKNVEKIPDIVIRESSHNFPRAQQQQQQHNGYI